MKYDMGLLRKGKGLQTMFMQWWNINESQQACAWSDDCLSYKCRSQIWLYQIQVDRGPRSLFKCLQKIIFVSTQKLVSLPSCFFPILSQFCRLPFHFWNFPVTVIYNHFTDQKPGYVFTILGNGHHARHYSWLGLLLSHWTHLHVLVLINQCLDESNSFSKNQAFWKLAMSSKYHSRFDQKACESFPDAKFGIWED